MEPVVIYALYRPGRDIFYAGKSRNLKRRLKGHRTRFGHIVQAVMLETCDGDWRAAEHFWIEVCREAGINLANLTEGGDGVETLSAKLRVQISVRQKGRVASEETRRKMSRVTKGKRRIGPWRESSGQWRLVSSLAPSRGMPSCPI